MIPISKEQLDKHSKSHFMVSFGLALAGGFFFEIYGVAIAFVLGILWELADEYYRQHLSQYPTWYITSLLFPNDSRGFSWLDIAMDFIGCGLAFGILTLLFI